MVHRSDVEQEYLIVDVDRSGTGCEERIQQEQLYHRQHRAGEFPVPEYDSVCYGPGSSICNQAERLYKPHESRHTCVGTGCNKHTVSVHACESRIVAVR